MNNNTFIRALMLLMAVIIGYRLVDHFDYNTMTFEQPAMDIMFGIGFVAALFIAFYKIGKRKLD